MNEFDGWIKKQKEAGSMVETFKSYCEFALRRAVIEEYAKEVDTYCVIKQGHYGLAYPAPVCPHRLGGERAR